MKRNIPLLACMVLLASTALSGCGAADDPLPASAVPAVDWDGGGTHRIHFLSTAGSDCMLIESNGKFALVDSAEDTDNPTGREGLVFEGHEDKIIDYLLAHAADENGNVTLEWVLGTHAHSDHIGGFDSIILHEKITVKKAFLKTYNEQYIGVYERKAWDNVEVWQQMMDACQAKGVEVVSVLPAEPWQFEGFTVQFFNADPVTKWTPGENENSVGTKLTCGGKSAFLAADMNHYTGVERRVAKEVGKVDLLKVAHHGYTLSSSRTFLKTLSPDISIVTNRTAGNIAAAVRKRLERVAESEIYTTGDYDGIIADFTADGIKLYSGIHA